MKPLHEYSYYDHKYLILTFIDPKLMTEYINKFNNNETDINVSNSYLCNDEPHTTIDIKICREN